MRVLNRRVLWVYGPVVPAHAPAPTAGLPRTPSNSGGLGGCRHTCTGRTPRGCWLGLAACVACWCICSHTHSMRAIDIVHTSYAAQRVCTGTSRAQACASGGGRADMHGSTAKTARVKAAVYDERKLLCTRRQVLSNERNTVEWYGGIANSKGERHLGKVLYDHSSNSTLRWKGAYRRYLKASKVPVVH
jgi:hypothetical protein